MSRVRYDDLTRAFGAEVHDVDPGGPVDRATLDSLRELFDRRGVLVFRDVQLTHPQQVELCEALIATGTSDDGISGSGASPVEDRWYISNRRERSAAPFGRLQFHSDTMWSSQPIQVLSLYGVEVEQPAVPTTFVSATHAWTTLPDELRARVAGRYALHTSGEVRRGDLTDVLLTTVESPPSTTSAIGHLHPRTSETILYVCEQMTKEVVGLPAEDSEELLDDLFAHLYDPARRIDHEWRAGDLVVWDNLSVQHARPNVAVDGPARTLRKVACPVVQLSATERPTYSAAS